ncbi:transposase [Nitratifractor sp.]
MDQSLDRSSKGALLHGKISEEIRDYYLNKEPEYFEVEALSIMPNHIHILLQQKHGITETLRILKGVSAHIVNPRALDRKGKVWSRDYYDRAVRDDEHYRRVYDYIRLIAVKAGLTDADQRFYGRYG